MIYLQPHSGLANRLRVIISGLHFSDIVQQELTLIWKKDKSLFCDFTDLFEPNGKIILKKHNWKLKILNSLQNKTTLYKLFSKLFSIDFSLFDKDAKEFVWSTGTNNFDLSKLPEKVANFYFSTCHEFCFDTAYIKYLRPISAIQKSIDKNVTKFTNKTIGIHVRRTDHLDSIEESPLEFFIETIRNDLEKDSSLNYFLATDDESVETILKNLFPGKINCYQKDYARINIKGVQDAVVDLYSLANTCKIYGSYFSSFSDIAARIGNIPLEIIKKK